MLYLPTKYLFATQAGVAHALLANQVPKSILLARALGQVLHRAPHRHAVGSIRIVGMPS